MKGKIMCKNYHFRRIQHKMKIKMSLKTAFCLLMALTLILGMLPVFSVSAAGHTSMVNLQRADKNNRGDGYYFHNPSNTLTLTNLKIDTADEYGMKVKIGTTIVLEGNNYIKASDIALFCPGEFTIKGTGSLTLVSGNRGIVVNTNETSDKVRLLEGTLKIESVNEAIYSATAGAALAGGKVDIKVSNPEANAISTRTLTISGNIDFDANSSVYSSYKMGITGANLDITSSRPAIICDGQLTFEDLDMKAGDSASSLAPIEAEAYAAQTAVSAKSTFKRVMPSIIFGAGVPVAVDYIILVLAIAAVAALIVVPILRHKARIKKLEAAGLAGNAAKKKKTRA